MNKQELAITKKIAEIEGREWRTDKEAGVITVSTMNRWNEGGIKCCSWYEYNPFDWSILGPLMKKYEVSVQHAIEYVFITQGWKDIEVSFDGEEPLGLERAILECIIKRQEA